MVLEFDSWIHAVRRTDSERVPLTATSLSWQQPSSHHAYTNTGIVIIILEISFTSHIKLKSSRNSIHFAWLLQALNTFPILLRIPGLFDKVFAGQKIFMDMVDDVVAEHRRTRDPAQPPRDLTDAFLDEMEKVRGYGMWCPVHCEVNPKCGLLETMGGNCGASSSVL